MRCFFFALRGFAYAVRTQRNMRVHLCFAFYVILAGLVTGISQSEWLAVLLCIGFVTALECANTAVETLCDTLHPQKSRGIGTAKDTAAAAVLCAAAASAVVGARVFFQAERISKAYSFLQQKPVLACLIILTLFPAVLFVRGKPEGANK